MRAPGGTALLRRRLLVFGVVLALPAAAWAQAGQAAFQTRCALCHQAEGGGQGPSLAGVVGRRAGTAPGFPYSDALKASGIVWTPAALDRFLEDPQGLVPGTAMPVAVPDPKARADLVAYLETLR